MYAQRPTLFLVHPRRTSLCLRTSQVVGEWLVVARGKLDPIVHGEEWQGGVHQQSRFWFWSAADRDSPIAFEPGCKLQKRGVEQASRNINPT